MDESNVKTVNFLDSLEALADEAMETESADQLRDVVYQLIRVLAEKERAIGRA